MPLDSAGTALTVGDAVTIAATVKSLPTEKAISAVTAANPGVITATAHGLETNDEIYIYGVAGMVELNDLKYRVHKIDANSFHVALSSTASKTISNVTKASPGVVTATSHGYSNTDRIRIDGVNGLPQLNGNMYKVTNKTAHTFELHDISNVDVDTRNYGLEDGGAITGRLTDTDTANAAVHRTAYVSGGVTTQMLNTTSFTAYTSGGKIARLRNGAPVTDIEVTLDGTSQVLALQGAQVTLPVPPGP